MRFKLLAARQEIDARSDLIAVGDFDVSYNIAVRGTPGLAEVGHAVDAGALPFSLDVYAAQGGDNRWKVSALAMYRSRHRHRQHRSVAITTIAISVTSTASSASPLP